MDTSSVSSSTGHSHLNGHRSIPPATLKAVVEASLKAVGQVKASREAVRLLSRRHQEYEKHNDERWEAMDARISQLESARSNEVHQDDHVNLVNGHHHHSQDDVSERPQDDADIINGQDDGVPTLTTFAPLQASSSFGAAPRDTSSPPHHSHISQSHTPPSDASPTSAVSSRQAAVSPVGQSALRSRQPMSPTRNSQLLNHSIDQQAGPCSPHPIRSPSAVAQISTEPFDIVPERLSEIRQRSLDNENDIEGYEAFIEEMEAPSKGKGRAKDMSNGVQERSSRGAEATYNVLRDVDIDDREAQTSATSSPFRQRDSPGLERQSVSIGEQYKALKAEHIRLKAWERQLEKQAARQEEVKAIHLDHEEELEKRLQAVMKREEKVQRAEAVLEIRSRGARPHEIEAAIYRRVEDSRAIRDECKRRAEELNEAEEAWCRAKKVDYVPVIKDGQWPFNVFPLDR